MLLTRFLLFFTAISFLNYAKKTDTIIVNEWLTMICTTRNVRIAKFAIMVDLILIVVFHAIDFAPATIALFS